MNKRFAHLLISDSDSDSLDLHRSPQPNEVNPPSTMCVQEKEEREDPIRTVLADVGREHELTAFKFNNANVVRVVETGNQGSFHQTELLPHRRVSEIASDVLSCGSSAARLPGRKGLPRRTTDSSMALSEKLNAAPGLLSGSHKTLVSSTNHPLMSLEDPTLSQAADAGGNVKAHTNTPKEAAVTRADFQDGTHLSTEELEVQAGVVGKKLGDTGSVGRCKEQLSFSGATATGVKAASHILSEKYWEKSYGFDPSKRKMPLFVAVEHCPPKRAYPKLNLPEHHHSSQTKPGGTAGSLTSFRSTRKSTHSVEDTMRVSQGDLCDLPHDDKLLKEGNRAVEAPSNIDDLISPNVDPLGNSLSVTRLNASAEHGQKGQRHRKSGSTRNSNGGGSLEVSHSALQEAPLCAQLTATDTEEEKYKSAFMTERQLDAMRTSEGEEVAFLGDRNAPESLNKVHAYRDSDFAQKDSCQQNIIVGDVAMSIVRDEIVKQEAFAKNMTLSYAEGGSVTRKERTSIKDECEPRTEEEGAAKATEGAAESHAVTPWRASELTVDSLRMLPQDGHVERKNGRAVREVGCAETSSFETCISFRKSDTGGAEDSSKDPNSSHRYRDPHDSQHLRRRREDFTIPAFHRRLIMDMEEMRCRDQSAMMRSMNEYTFDQNARRERHRRLPQRKRQQPQQQQQQQQQQQNLAEAATHPPDDGVRRTGPRMPARRPPYTEPQPTFKPVISKYAQESQRSTAPYHKRLYTPRIPSPPSDVRNGINDLSPRLSPQLKEMIYPANASLFHPNISPRAKAIENNWPFHKRLYPSKEKLERRRMADSPSTPSPRRSPRRSPHRAIAISPHLLERPAAPVDKSRYSFRPEISPRAMNIENNVPFHKRLYPEKEKLERRRMADSPSTPSPRRSPHRAIAISPHLLERPAAPVDKSRYSFRPEISPRAMNIENNVPFHERLYPEKEKLERRRMGDMFFVLSPHRSPERAASISPRLLERLAVQTDDLSCSFHPVISPRAMNIENNVPFHERLYPDSEERELRMQYEKHQERFLNLVSCFQTHVTCNDRHDPIDEAETRENVGEHLD